jgi:hypothetical protein
MKKIIYAMTVLVLSAGSDVVWAQKDEGRFSGLLNKIKSKFSKSSKSQDSDKPELSMESILDGANSHSGHTVNSPNSLKNSRNAVDLRGESELSMESIVNAANAQAKSKKTFK